MLRSDVSHLLVGDLGRLGFAVQHGWQDPLTITAFAFTYTSPISQTREVVKNSTSFHFTIGKKKKKNASQTPNPQEVVTKSAECPLFPIYPYHLSFLVAMIGLVATV